MKLYFDHSNAIYSWINNNIILLVDKAVILFSIIAFYMNVWPHWYANGGLPTIFPIYLVFLYGIIRMIMNPNIFKKLARLGYTWWLIFYLLIVTANYFITSSGLLHLYGDAIQDVYNVQVTFLGTSIAFLVLLCYKENFIFARNMMVLAVLAGVVVNFLDIVDFTEKWNNTSLRGAGYYINPNSSAINLSIGYLLTAFTLSKKWKLPYFLIFLSGVLATMSKGAIPIILLLLCSLVITGAINVKSIMLMIISLVIVSFSISMIVQDSEKYSLLTDMVSRNENYQSRLKTFANPFKNRLETGVRDEVAIEHVKFYLRSPIVGNGLSSSLYAEQNLTETKHSSHIQYVHMLNEFGLFGLVMLFSLPVAMSIYRSRLYIDLVVVLFGLVYFIGCLSSHNMYDSKSLLFSYALLGVFLSHKYVHD